MFLFQPALCDRAIILSDQSDHSDVMVWYSENPTEGPKFLFHPGGGFVGRRTQVFFANPVFLLCLNSGGLISKKTLPQNIFQRFWLKSDFFGTLGTLVFVVFACFHDGTGFRPFLMRANNKSFEEAEIP